MNEALEIIYMFFYIVGTLLLAKGIQQLYFVFMRFFHKPQNLIGEVIETYSTKKYTSKVYIVPKCIGRISLTATWFNSIKVLQDDGVTKYVLESYNEINNIYNGAYTTGDKVELTIRKYDSKYYLNDVIFNEYYGIKEPPKTP